MERLLEDLSYNASDMNGVDMTIDAAYVEQNLADLAMDDDLSRYIL